MERSPKKISSPEIAVRPKRTRRAADARTSDHAVIADDIARVAYEIYVARGRADGAHLDDWLEAERRLHRTRP
jgi:hypothetical protein